MTEPISSSGRKIKRWIHFKKIKVVYLAATESKIPIMRVSARNHPEDGRA